MDLGTSFFLDTTCVNGLFSDVRNPLPESVELLEDMVMEYVSEMVSTHQTWAHSSHSSDKDTTGDASCIEEGQAANGGSGILDPERPEKVREVDGTPADERRDQESAQGTRALPHVWPNRLTSISLD